MNLIWLLTSIIQYKFAWDKRDSIQKMKLMFEESGAVWQKFAQMLSTKEDIIGTELAIEFQKMLFECPTHSDEYSREIITKMFGNKYDLDKMKQIGSGTIAQVYVIENNKCIKVRHPNVVREVMDAISVYDKVKNMFFMPNVLRTVCDNFFEGLVEQFDFHKEFANGNTFKQLMHENTRPQHNLFVIPSMLDVSDECLVMEYEPSQPLILSGRDKIDKHVLLKCLNGITTLSYQYGYMGFIHADLHPANIGIRNYDDIDKVQIVIYDFGHMLDMRNVDENIRYNAVKSACIYDFNIISDILLGEYPHHKQQFMNTVSNLGSDKAMYMKKCIMILQYITIHSIDVAKYKICYMMSLEKNICFNNVIYEIETDTEYQYMHNYIRENNFDTFMDKYFPYDDLQILKTRFGDLTPTK